MKKLLALAMALLMAFQMTTAAASPAEEDNSPVHIVIYDENGNVIFESDFEGQEFSTADLENYCSGLDGETMEAILKGTSVEIEGAQVTGAEGLTVTATDNSEGEGVTVRVEGDVKSLTAEENGAVIVDGDVVSDETGIRLPDTEDGEGSLQPGNAAVSVSGDVEAYLDGIVAEGNGNVEVEGSVTAGHTETDTVAEEEEQVPVEIFVGNGIAADGEATVAVGGDVEAAAQGVTANGSSEVTVSGSVLSEGAGGITTGDGHLGEKEISAEAAVTVEGDVNAKDDGVFATGESSVTVEGSVTSTEGAGVTAREQAEVLVGGDVNAYGNGITAGGDAAVEVEGSVTAGHTDQVIQYNDQTGQDEPYDIPAGTGILAEDSATVEVKGGVQSANVGIEAGGNATVAVDGDVASGTNAISETGGAAVTVNGNLDAGDGTAYMVDAVNSEGSGDAEITVNGDVSAVGDTFARGIVLGGYGDDVITVNGDVEAEAGRVYGIVDYPYDGGEARETQITVNGDLTATGEVSARGISVEGLPTSPESTASVTVTGRVSTESKGWVMEETDPETGETIFETGRDIVVSASAAEGVEIVIGEGIEGSSGHNSVTGMNVYTSTADDRVSVEIRDGGITVSTEDELASATAVGASNAGGDIIMEITGDVESSGSGIDIYSGVLSFYSELPEDFTPGENDVLIEGESGSVSYYNPEGGFYYVMSEYGGWLWGNRDNDGTTEITVHGDVRTGGQGTGLTVRTEDETGGADSVPKAKNETVTRVEIEGDLSGGETGILVDSAAESATVDLIVDGTVSGNEHGIVLSSATETEGLTITVWKVSMNGNGAAVERATGTPDEGGNGGFEEDLSAEKEIQYIIRIAQPDLITTNGTENYRGFEVAHEGDTVYVKLNVPEGYEISHVWQDEEKTVSLVKDADGNYYMGVPKGGGVLLSATLVPKRNEPAEPEKKEPEQAETVRNVREPAPAQETPASDEEIAAAAAGLLTINDAAADNEAAVETDETTGEKTVVISPKNPEEGEEAAALKLTVPAELISMLAEQEIASLVMENADGSAELSLDLEAVQAALEENPGAHLEIRMENRTEEIAAALERISGDYRTLEGAVAVNVVMVDAEGNAVQLDGADISIRLRTEFTEGMKILYIDGDGQVTVTEAVWTDAAETEPGFWSVPYLGRGIYVPALSME